MRMARSDPRQAHPSGNDITPAQELPGIETPGHLPASRSSQQLIYSNLVQKT